MYDNKVIWELSWFSKKKKSTNWKNNSVSKNHAVFLYKWSLLLKAWLFPELMIRPAPEMQRLIKEPCGTELQCRSFNSVSTRETGAGKVTYGIGYAQVTSDCLVLVCTIYCLELAFHFQINHFIFRIFSILQISSTTMQMDKRTATRPLLSLRLYWYVVILL